MNDSESIQHSMLGLPDWSSEDFDQIGIGIASPDKIRSWAKRGGKDYVVKKAETINYRTFKPEVGGLFCAQIFGPTRDYECLCGKYKRMKYRGITCEKCGVEVTLSKVRRERVACIELWSPVAHIWFLKSLPSRIGLALDMSLKELQRVLYFENYVVIDPKMTKLEKKQLLSETEYDEAIDEYGEGKFEAGIGAEAIRKLLASINLEEEQEQLRGALVNATSETKRTKIVKRLKLMDSFIKSKARPEWMVLTVLPVMPPELRPLVPLDAGRFASSDLNELYKRVINRNNRIKRYLDLRAPEIILRNEKRLLQEAVDALFDNGRNGRPATGKSKRPLKSISDMLKGKQGRFRQNLLGKRVDYSGRSVIVVGPELKLHQCGLPKLMALELFKPFVYSRLELFGIANTIKLAKRMVEMERPEVWDILEQVIREHPVMLNRAPTLHRLGVQAFEPVLIEGKAIQLHPLVCAAFNADFDGDQMAVHVPLSLEAQLEARVLMMSTNNILSPANGKPIIVPSQDIVLGLYYLSLANKKPAGRELDKYASPEELGFAHVSGHVKLHDLVEVRMTIWENNTWVTRLVETTLGRIRLMQILPKESKIPFAILNKDMTKREITNVIDHVYRFSGQKDTVIFCDQLMRLGFRQACKAGISFGIDDLKTPDAKAREVKNAEAKVKEFEKQYQDGLITSGEKYNKVVDAWTQCTDIVASEMMETIANKKFDSVSDFNSVNMMADSGARGSPAQMKQLAGMRGLMAKPSGEIIELPIIASFKEGLNVLDYFSSTHGARKGLADTALKTAQSGYMTRKLVDVAQDSIITERDCGSSDGLTLRDITHDGEVVDSLGERILGRTAAEDIRTLSGDKVLVAAGKIITEENVEAIVKADIDSVKVRSVLTCKTKIGVCAGCYGRDLARGTEVNIGEAVGVIAAQSIGEPGTQLTMRTFHIGGVAQRGAEQSSIEAVADGVIELEGEELIPLADNSHLVMNRHTELRLVDKQGRELAHHRLRYGAKLFAQDKANVTSGQKLVEWDPYTFPIISEVAGRADYGDLIEGISMKDETDDTTGITNQVVLDWSIYAAGKSRGRKSEEEKLALAKKTEEDVAKKSGIREHARKEKVLEAFGFEAQNNKKWEYPFDDKDARGLYFWVLPAGSGYKNDLSEDGKTFTMRMENGGRIAEGESQKKRQKHSHVFFVAEKDTKATKRYYAGEFKFDETASDDFKWVFKRTATETKDMQGKLWVAPKGKSPLPTKTTTTSKTLDRARLKELRPRITIHGMEENSDAVILPNGQEARYLLPAGAILSVKDSTEVKAGDVLARIPRESLKTRDITGGLPRVAELFEARTPKNPTVMSKTDGVVERIYDLRGKRIVQVLEGDTPHEYAIPKDTMLAVQVGDSVKKGQELTLDGNPVPHDILSILDIEALADYLVNEVQNVYRLQGVKINDKHIEVILHQMLQKVEITDAGDTTLLVGEQITKQEFEEANTKAKTDGAAEATAKPVLLGITKASLQTNSFISAASFQETTRVLTEAATSGRIDYLSGLKENVIVGRLIPAGTGSVMADLKVEAFNRDKEIQAEREAYEAAKQKKFAAERAAREASGGTSAEEPEVVVLSKEEKKAKLAEAKARAQSEEMERAKIEEEAAATTTSTPTPAPEAEAKPKPEAKAKAVATAESVTDADSEVVIETTETIKITKTTKITKTASAAKADAKPKAAPKAKTTTTTKTASAAKADTKPKAATKTATKTAPKAKADAKTKATPKAKPASKSKTAPKTKATRKKGAK